MSFFDDDLNKSTDRLLLNVEYHQSPLIYQNTNDVTQ